METREKQVMNILKRVLGVDNIDETVSQQNCAKWDSIAHLNLIVEIEMQFGISFEPDEIAEITSFQDIVRILEKK